MFCPHTLGLRAVNDETNASLGQVYWELRGRALRVQGWAQIAESWGENASEPVGGAVDIKSGGHFSPWKMPAFAVKKRRRFFFF